MAAKIYRITFSPKGERLAGAQDKREAEISILQQLFEFAANQASTFKEANLCLDLSKQMQNLTGEQSVTFTQEDHGRLNIGFKATTGLRPNTWWLCGELLKQLESPNEEIVK